MADQSEDSPVDKNKMSAEEQRVADLLDKKERALENLAKMCDPEIG